MDRIIARMKIRLHKHLNTGPGSSSDDIFMYKDVEIPIEPFVGLTVYAKQHDHEITRIIVRTANALISCWTVNYGWRGHREKFPIDELHEYAKVLKKEGWMHDRD